MDIRSDDVRWRGLFPGWDTRASVGKTLGHPKKSDSLPIPEDRDSHVVTLSLTSLPFFILNFDSPLNRLFESLMHKNICEGQSKKMF